MSPFKFHSKPYPHQKDVFEKTKDKEYWALNLEMGLGKSKIALDTASYLFQKGAINLCFILAPKGVYDTWIRNEIPSHVSPDIPIEILRWQPSLTKKFLQQLEDGLVSQNHEEKKLVFFLMNIEAMSTKKGVHYATQALELNPNNLMVVDESTTIKTHNSKRTKSVLSLASLSKFRRVLTGSPVTKSPLDLFSQCAFLSPHALGFKNYYSFERYFSVYGPRMTIKGKSFNKIVTYQRIPELTEKLTHFSTRLLKEDCLNLPDKVYLKRQIEFTPEQKEIYLQIKRLGIAKLESGELQTTASVLSQIIRMQQVCCGIFKPDDSEKTVSIPSNRINELGRILEEVDGKVLIWASFVDSINEITSFLKDKYGSRTVESFYGATPQKERQNIVERFQDPDDPLRYFVANPATGGFGLTLTAARTAIYFSNSYSYEHRLQSEARAHRISQKFMLTIIDLCAVDQSIGKTIDEKILESLLSKKQLSDTVLGDEIRDWLL